MRLCVFVDDAKCVLVELDNLLNLVTIIMSKLIEFSRSVDNAIMRQFVSLSKLAPKTIPVIVTLNIYFLFFGKLTIVVLQCVSGRGCRQFRPIQCQTCLCIVDEILPSSPRNHTLSATRMSPL